MVSLKETRSAGTLGCRSLPVAGAAPIYPHPVSWTLWTVLQLLCRQALWR